MNNKLILVVVLIVLVLGGFLLFNNKSTNTKTSTQTNNQNTTPTETMNQNAEDTKVTVKDTGYEPQTLKIKAGTQVVWTNNSGTAVTVNSDNHPTHLLWPFLNLGKFDDEASVSVIFEKAGTYTYHNHFDASQTGTVIVE